MSHKDIDTITFKDLLEKEECFLLDVRTRQEYDQSHLKGASHIDFYGETLEDLLDELDKGKKYLVYCRSGNRSRKTMLLMRELGFGEVYNLGEGIISWNEHGFELET
jgi:rhodanese-related sulfurtransferase